MNHKRKYYLTCFSSLFFSIVLLPIMSNLGSDFSRVLSSSFSWLREYLFIIYALFTFAVAVIAMPIEFIMPNWSSLIAPPIVFSLYLMSRSFKWEKRIDMYAVLTTSIFLSAMTSAVYTDYMFKKNHSIVDELGKAYSQAHSLNSAFMIGEAIFLSIIIVELINLAIQRTNKNKQKSL